MATARIRFTVPDLTVSKDDRAFFATAAVKEVVDQTISLNDARTDPRIIKDSGGLDAQGFTWIKHHSAITESDQFFSGKNISDIYLPEIRDMICQVTGAKQAIVINAVFRARVLNVSRDPKDYYVKGCDEDIEIAKLPRDITMIYGLDKKTSLEPAQPAHIDYTLGGLRTTLRECRRDITAMTQHVIDAEDARGRGEDATVPRYAAYSVWRPIRIVKRDPLVVCDYRTIDKDGLFKSDYRAVSEQNANGEYTMEYWGVSPPKDPKQRQWYWIPEQKPEEVLIIKFADSASETDATIAAGCPHAAVLLPDTEDEEIRYSIEVRVLVTW